MSSASETTSAVYQTAASGLADIAADLGGFCLGDEGVSGHNWFAPFDVIGTEEVADLAEVLRLAEHEDGGDLSHAFELIGRRA